MGVVVLAGLLALGVYAFGGWRDAGLDAAALKAEARRLIAEGRGPDDLGADRLAVLILVEDPNFWSHDGVDLATPGAGAPLDHGDVWLEGCAEA